MANLVYPKYRKASVSGGANTDLIAGNVKAVMVDGADYSYSATHEFLSDIIAGARVGTTGNLTGKSITDGALFDAADIVISTVSGDPTELLAIYIDTGVEGTSRLVALIDTGVTYTPNGNNVNIAWNAGGIIQF